MFLRKIEEQEDTTFDIEVMKKMLICMRKQNRFIKVDTSVHEPIFELQKYCDLSACTQRQHWEALELQVPNLLRIRVQCSVVGLGMIDGKISFSFFRCYCGVLYHSC